MIPHMMVYLTLMHNNNIIFLYNIVIIKPSNHKASEDEARIVVTHIWSTTAV